MSANLDAIKARIRALQARTQGRGCTEAEASAAAEAMVRLMAEHGLSEAEIATSEQRVKIVAKADVRDLMMPALAAVSRCCLYTATGDARHAVYVGRDPWPECAAWLHSVVFGAMARASRDFTASPEMKRRRTARTKGQARQAFMTAFALRLRSRLWALIDGSDAYRADVALAKAAVDAVKGLKPSKAPPQPKVSDRFGDAYASGLARADGVQLSWGIRGPAATLAIRGPR